MSDRSRRLGIDVGGTFTDVVAAGEDGFSVTKVPSTPGAPEEGVLSGVTESEVELERVGLLAHGTTVATNAVLEHNWARTALVTTAGFRDVLEIGRQHRPSLYDLRVEGPTPIVPRQRRLEVAERIDERGAVQTPLDPSSIDEIVDRVEDAEVESVAISFLFAYENDEHERRLAEAFDDSDSCISISRSSVVLPEIREYERTLATALNAGLKPVMDRYIGRLEGQLEDAGLTAPLRIMQSNGGIIGADFARERPINTLLSGPAAGVQGAAAVAARADFENIITIDMGGTSCDVSLVEQGDAVVSTDVTVGEYPVSVPMVDIHTIGAGGGSIAWVDAGGALRVGPQSAGAEPGPVSYGRGGRKPTVTDAQVVLGRIEPASFLPAALEPAPAAAREVIATDIAEPLDRTVEEAAMGMIEVANANMERAIRVVSVERGHDPRSFALVAFGGAGPLHAPAIARSLDIPSVVIPRAAGVLSALGLLVTNLTHEFSRSQVRPWEEVEAETLRETIAEFAATGRERLRESGQEAGAIEVAQSVDVRYAGQSSSLSIPVEGTVDEAALDRVAERFHDSHRRRYGHAAPEERIELETIRVRVRRLVEPPELRIEEDSSRAISPTSKREVRYPSGEHDTEVYDRSALYPGVNIQGPAIIGGAESTVLLYPDQRGRVDEYGSILVEQVGGEGV